MTSLIQTVRFRVRSGMRVIARGLNTLTGGKLSPNTVTIVGLVMHAPIAWLIAVDRPLWAAVLLVIFGLFDTLDGELARLQNRSSARGMLLDAATDRMKEVMLYAGIAYLFAMGNSPGVAAWATAALGASVCVSYVKAKGEAAVASAHKNMSHTELNKLFADGLLSFEVRMVLLIAGLLSGLLLPAVVIIAIGSTATAVSRLVRISRKL